MSPSSIEPARLKSSLVKLTGAMGFAMGLCLILNATHRGSERMVFEQKFKKDVLERFDRAEAKMSGYKFKIIRDLIEQHGAVVTAKGMMQASSATTIQYGLDALAENDLLDCSLEQAVIDHEVSGAFTKSEIAVAKTKLKIVREKHQRK
jgi:hypothetical protein